MMKFGEGAPGPVQPRKNVDEMIEEAAEKGFTAEAQEDPEEIERILQEEGFQGPEDFQQAA